MGYSQPTGEERNAQWRKDVERLNLEYTEIISDRTRNWLKENIKNRNDALLNCKHPHAVIRDYCKWVMKGLDKKYGDKIFYAGLYL